MNNTNRQQLHAFQTNASDRGDFGDSIALVRLKVRVRCRVQNAFLDWDYYPVTIMTGHCNRYCGRCHKEGPQFPLYLAYNLVVISPIDRADVTPHTIALMKVFE
jgi:hypothetical protein